MSWLLLDAGNSALKWEAVSERAARWPEAGSSPRTPDVPDTRWRGSVGIDAPDLAPVLARACAATGAPAGMTAATLVAGCAVTSEERMRSIESAVRAAIAAQVQWFAATPSFGHDGILLRNSYRDPLQLGADRWHALIGARARFPEGTLAVVGAGTATTVDGLGEDGRHLGGTIAPGIDLMRDSLANRTARLPRAAGTYVAHPDNTEDAICTGILDAQLGLVERRVHRIREAAGTNVRVVLCGGSALNLFAQLQGQAGFGNLALEPDLVLRGLWHRVRAGAADPAPLPAC